MKCEIIIDSSGEEKVVVYAKENNAFVEEIKILTEQQGVEILGYKDNEIIRLNLAEICCITVINNRVYAIADKEQYLIKERLYSVEEKLPENFVKINQSCIGNIKQMERFDTSISGTLKIRFKNDYVDYVSRRQLKQIKERIGI